MPTKLPSFLKFHTSPKWQGRTALIRKGHKTQFETSPNCCCDAWLVKHFLQRKTIFTLYWTQCLIIMCHFSQHENQIEFGARLKRQWFLWLLFFSVKNHFTQFSVYTFAGSSLIFIWFFLVKRVLNKKAALQYRARTPLVKYEGQIEFRAPFRTRDG